MPAAAAGAKGSLAHARITPSTSSRFSSMCSSETSDSRFRRRSGSVFDGPDVEVPVLVVHRDAVELAHLAVRVALLELLHLPVLVLHLGVDLAGDEVALAQRLEQLAERLALDREQLEDQERRDRPGVGAVEVAEVVVAGHLAAEGRADLAHARLEERVAHPVDEGRAAGGLHHVAHGARGAHVVEDRGARLLAQDRLGEQRREEVAVHEAAGVVDEEAAVGVAVPGDAEVGAVSPQPCRR